MTSPEAQAAARRIAAMYSPHLFERCPFKLSDLSALIDAEFQSLRDRLALLEAQERERDVVRRHEVREKMI